MAFNVDFDAPMLFVFENLDQDDTSDDFFGKFVLIELKCGSVLLRDYGRFFLKIHEQMMA